MSMIPLCSSARRAFRCRFTMLIPSMVSRPVFWITRITFPSLPLSLPRITRTVSPLVTGMRTRSVLIACRVTLRFFAVLRCVSTRMLQYLRRQRDDLHVLLLAELARHGTEDARRARLARLVDDHHRVLVEPDVAPVLAAGLLGGAHDDRARHVRLLHGAVGERVLHGDDHDVAEPRIAAARPSEHADDESGLRSRVVRDLDDRLLLNHGPVPSPLAG